MIDLYELLIFLNCLMKGTLQDLIIQFFLFEKPHELLCNWSLFESRIGIILMLWCFIMILGINAELDQLFFGGVILRERFERLIILLLWADII